MIFDNFTKLFKLFLKRKKTPPLNLSPLNVIKGREENPYSILLRQNIIEITNST